VTIRSARRWHLLAVTAALVALLLVLPSHFANTRPVGPPESTPPALRATALGPVAPRVSLGSASSAAAPLTAGWVALSGVGTGPTPKGELAGSLVYDPSASEYVYFGGYETASSEEGYATANTWTFSNDSWRNATDAAHAPPARYYSDMDYDANAGGVLLFGGVNAAGSDLNDTWLFRGGSWTEVNETGPSPRGSGVMAFDPEPDVNATVLFGGCDITASLACTNDTWTWRPSAGWTRLFESAGPSPRAFAFGGFDPASGAIVLFGGLGPCPGIDCDFQDTWQFSGGAWSPIDVHGTGPTARYSGGFGYDPAGSDMLLYGGYNLSADSTEESSWTLAGDQWEPLAASPTPGYRGDPSLASGGYGAPPLLYGGGEDDAPSMPTDTWAFVAPLAVLAGSGGSTQDTGIPVDVNVTVEGGAPPYEVTTAWGTNRTEGTGNATNWSFVQTFPVGSVNVSVTVVDAFHADANSTVSFDVVRDPSVAIEAPVVTTDVGVSLNFLATVISGGVSPLSLVWTFGDGANGSGSFVNHSYEVAGNYSVGLNAADGLGALASATVTVDILPLPSASIALSGLPAIGTSLNFSGQVSGGLPPYSYAWLFDDGGGSGLVDPSHAYLSAGNFTVQFWANDSLGASSHASVLVTVPPTHSSGNGHAPGGGSPAGGAVPWVWIGLAVVGLAVAAGAVVAVTRGRPRRPVLARRPTGDPPRR
jgi:hypothetical protein